MKATIGVFESVIGDRLVSFFLALKKKRLAKKVLLNKEKKERKKYIYMKVMGVGDVVGRGRKKKKKEKKKKKTGKSGVGKLESQIE